MTEYINYNGKIIRKEDWKLSPDNRSFRYGDGLFETIKVINNKIILEDYHFERLFPSLELLKFDTPKNFNAKKITQQILELVQKNNHEKLARVRLTFYRGEGGLYDEISHTPNYIIQSWQLNSTINNLNINGLVAGLYTDGRKSCDSFSSLKTNNFLCYTMAALWAKENKFNDAIVLNNNNNVADATIANVFIVKNGSVYTSTLNDGAINGVMRRHIIKCLKQEGINVEEKSLTTDDVLQANEVFLTNAISGLKWVKQIGNSNYTSQLSAFLHQKFISTLFK